MNDLFTNVHKGLRGALFTACAALGRAGADPEQLAAARACLVEVLRFVAAHGDNEDRLLLPLLRERAPEIHAAMTRDHHALDAERERLSGAPAESLYLEACAFTARYLAHLDEEERVFEPAIRAVVSNDEIAAFGRESVARTAPADQQMMLGWMLPALPGPVREAFLGRLPVALADALRTRVAGREAPAGKGP